MTRALHKGYELIGLFASIQALMEIAILGDFHQNSSPAGGKVLEFMLPRFRDDERESVMTELLAHSGEPEHRLALEGFKGLKKMRDLLGHGIPYAEDEDSVAILKLGGRGYTAHVEVLTRGDLEEATGQAEKLRNTLADFVEKQGWGANTPIHLAIRNLKGPGRGV